MTGNGIHFAAVGLAFLQSIVGVSKTLEIWDCRDQNQFDVWHRFALCVVCAGCVLGVLCVLCVLCVLWVLCVLCVLCVCCVCCVC